MIKRNKEPCRALFKVVPLEIVDHIISVSRNLLRVKIYFEEVVRHIVFVGFAPFGGSGTAVVLAEEKQRRHP